MTETEETISLVDAYAEAATSHGESTRAGDYLAANQAADRMVEIVQSLRNHGSQAHGMLVGLINHERVEVRSWAATHTLEIAPIEAELALERIARGPDSLEQFSAELVLDQWRRGEIEFP